MKKFIKKWSEILFFLQPDIVDFLKKHKLSSHLRPKMIDWMIEVVAYVFRKPTVSALFRSITTMDVYLK